MKKILRPLLPCLSAVMLLVSAGPQVRAAAPDPGVDSGRVALLAGLLPVKPQGTGPVCSNREAWGKPEIAERVAPLTDLAKKLVPKPFPPWDDQAYLENSAGGPRAAGEHMMYARTVWLYPLVLAECAEGAGRYIPVIEHVLSELATQPTWTWPAHDTGLRNFKNHDYEVDLLAADTAHQIAQTLYLLGDKLSSAVRQQSMAAIEARVFAPVRQSVLHGGKDNWWLTVNHNWNAVCLKGVVGAALAVLPDRNDRALFAAAGEHYIQYYLSGFPDDGYSPEGPGYWDFGFSHFTELREILFQQTRHQVDLFSDPKVRRVALYGYRIEMLPGNVAAFGDSPRSVKMDDFTRAYVNDAFAFGEGLHLDKLPLSTIQGNNEALIVEAAIEMFSVVKPTEKTEGAEHLGLQSYFNTVGVLVSRPEAGGKMGVSIKAGGNGNHSHNDIGSYAIALADEQPIGDIGAPVYSAKTFGPLRNTIKGINSYGHPVPLVGGQLQRDASQVAPHVLATSLTDAEDSITIDMASAYNVPMLSRLTRTLNHRRGQGGSIDIEDDFAFGAPQTFEVALIASDNYRDLGGGHIEFWQKSQHLMASIEASAPYQTVFEKVEDEGQTFTRVAIRLVDKAREGFVRTNFKPVADDRKVGE